MRSLVVLTMCLLWSACPAVASGVKTVDSQKLNDLELRAEHAQPQDQCYLFAQVVAQMGEVADSQLARGDDAGAQKTLSQMETYMARIQHTMGPRNKKLKESEILVRQTARRVDGMFHEAALEQQDMLRNTLHKLNAVQAELMQTVFQH